MKLLLSLFSALIVLFLSACTSNDIKDLPFQLANLPNQLAKEAISPTNEANTPIEHTEIDANCNKDYLSQLVNAQPPATAESRCGSKRLVNKGLDRNTDWFSEEKDAFFKSCGRMLTEMKDVNPDEFAAFNEAGLFALEAEIKSIDLSEAADVFRLCTRIGLTVSGDLNSQLVQSGLRTMVGQKENTIKDITFRDSWISSIERKINSATEEINEGCFGYKPTDYEREQVAKNIEWIPKLKQVYWVLTGKICNTKH